VAGVREKTRGNRIKWKVRIRMAHAVKRDFTKNLTSRQIVDDENRRRA